MKQRSAVVAGALALGLVCGAAAPGRAEGVPGRSGDGASGASGTLFQQFLHEQQGGNHHRGLNNLDFEQLCKNEHSRQCTEYLHELEHRGDPITAGGTVTPEPISLLLFGTGLAGVAAARRRRRNAGEDGRA